MLRAAEGPLEALSTEGKAFLVMDTWRLDRAEGLLRTLSMHTREAVERRAYQGQTKSLRPFRQHQKNLRGQKIPAPVEFSFSRSHGCRLGAAMLRLILKRQAQTRHQSVMLAVESANMAIPRMFHQLPKKVANTRSSVTCCTLQEC